MTETSQESKTTHEDEQLAVHVTDDVGVKLSLFRPEGTPRAVVLFMPGLSIAATYYQPFVQALCEQGFWVASSDLRGVGTSTVRVGKGVDFGFRELAEEDLPAIIRTVQDRLNTEGIDLPLLLVGHSLGGQLGAIYAGMKPDELQGLVVVAGGSLWYQNWSGRLRIRVWVAGYLYGVVARMLGYFPGRWLGFGEIEAKTLMLDWCRVVLTGRYTLHGATYDHDGQLARYRGPVLGIAVAGDRMAPPASVKHLLGKLNAAKVMFREVELDGAPPPGPRLHMRWARRPRPVVAAIDGWARELGW